MLCVTPYPVTNAGVRLRIAQQLELLAAHGVDVTISPFLDDAGYSVAFEPGNTLAKAAAVVRGFGRRLTDALRVSAFDLLLVYRESAPFGPLLVERAARSRGIPVVVDFDESLFLPNIHTSNRRWQWLRDPGRLAAACRLANGVIAQNQFLADTALAWNDNVAVMPTPVDTRRRHPAPNRRPGPTVVGWIGSETTAIYLHLMDEALARLSRELDVIVRVVGGEYRNDRIKRLEVIPFSLEREQADLEGIDVGILPEPDDTWTRGKGGYKALLYMAAGIPVVASRVGVNPDIVVDGETGYCVETTDEWIECIRTLALDSELRRRLGTAGRARAEELYSIEAVAPRFAAVIRAAGTNRP